MVFAVNDYGLFFGDLSIGEKRYWRPKGKKYFWLSSHGDNFT